MLGEWPEVPLSELTDPDTPVTYGVVKPGPEDPDGVLFIRGGDIAEGRVLTEQLRTITREVSEQYRRTQLRGGEIVVSLVGNPGQVAIVPESLKGANIARQAALVRLRDDVDTRFVKYYLSSQAGQDALGAHSLGSVQQVINLRDLKTVRVPVPPLSEQRVIAHILGMLDDKIALNRGMSATLDAMARALFKSWFVDFNPVRAKAKGGDPALRKPLADLFPASLVDSELGEIPEGWDVGTLLDLSVLNPEVWTNETRPLELEYVDLSNTKWGRIEAVTSYKAVDAPSRAQRVLRRGDTIVGTVRPGNGSYTFIAEHGLTGSTGFAVLRPRKAEYAEFVYLAATAADNIDRLAHLADGAAYPAVRAEVVAATPIARAGDRSDEVFRWFSRVAHPLLAKIAHNESESRNLTALRDTLLPKLISGELRVKDAARFIPRVV
jgi:type I restriction enzyme S subunit